ncbi:hypothetical protein BH20CHL4_BH20CHL4_03260 [soil metagenome]
MDPFAPYITTIEPRRKASRWRRMLLILLIAAVAAYAGNRLAGDATARFDSTTIDRYVSFVSAARDVAVAKIGEKPGLASNPAEGPLPLCDDVSGKQARVLTEAVALMRATGTGVALYDLLEVEGVCIGVEDLPYNSAFALSRWSPANGWADSEIRVDTTYISSLYPDVLSAILVHEAKHIERAITRTACYYASSCTTLPNGVELEEEIIAHGAEAEWWIEVYGRDGKEWAFGSDHAQNQLKAAYLRGPAEFRDFVEQARSDTREGQGI